MNLSPKSMRITAAACLVSMLWLAATLWMFHYSEDALKQRSRSTAAIADSSLLLDQVQAVEGSQRGYLLTGKVEFLEPYLAISDLLAQTQATLASRLTMNPVQERHLKTLSGLIRRKQALLAKLIVQRRVGDFDPAIAGSSLDEGRLVMDAIRGEVASIKEFETEVQTQREATYLSSTRLLLATIIGSGLLSVFGAIAFAYGYYQRNALKLRQQVHENTLRQLAQEALAGATLQRLNHSLSQSEERLAVTLSSIGDAVITTDRSANVTGLNPVGEQLTGWTQAQAIGQPVGTVFHIINKKSRLPSAIPVVEALASGVVQGLANHTVLIARDGVERDIADSCAPIRDRDSQVVGAVLVFRDVTEAYAVQQRLRDGAALVQAILDTVVDGIVTIHATTGRIETVSRAAERMFGHRAKELQGCDLGEVIPDFAQAAGREVISYFGADDAARAKGGGREVDGRRKDGSSIPLEIVASEMQLGGERFFAVIMRDVTARKQVEEALVKATDLQNQIQRDQQFYTRSLIESNIDALMTTDPAGVITDVNKQMEALTARSRDELIGAPCENFFTDHFKATEAIRRVQLESKVTDYELTACTKDGRETVVSYNASCLYDRGGVLQGVLAIARDVTERKRWDTTLQANTTELTTAKAAAEKANLAKSDFLSSMSHELRSPLNAILGFAQLMESDAPAPSPVQKASIDQILHAGWYLLELINEILDLAVIESGRLTLSLEAVSLPEIMLECQAMIEPQALKRRITMTFPAFAPPVFILADHTRLKQVLINLLSNAIKYNKLGGSVVVTCTASAGHYRICVTDTGLGLSSEKQAQLFQPFNRLGQEMSGEEGTGIGLVVSKRLVELMHGSIGVESTVGMGSSFCITLKTGEDPMIGYVAAVGSAVTSTPRPTGLPARLLLYVEDSRANRQLMEQLISRRADMRLLTAENGLDGIEIARRSLPDAILMDINLPGMSGIEAMQVLRKDPLTAHIPIIALSANAIPSDIEKGLESGFFRYLTKPIKVNELLETLKIAFTDPATKAE
jgi:PAS domain S-box-containing protein